MGAVVRVKPANSPQGAAERAARCECSRINDELTEPKLPNAKRYYHLATDLQPITLRNLNKRT